MTSSARQINSRPPLEWMLQLPQLLLDGKYPNCSKLGKRLEISPKTIQRDTEFMRGRHGLLIEHDPATPRYDVSAPTGISSVSQ